MFPEGTVRALWCPSRINLADMITRASLDPISVANSDAYRIGVLPTGDKINQAQRVEIIQFLRWNT